MPAHHVFKMPDNMSFQDGAALVMNYVTAYVLLFDLANLRKGQSVLVHSVGGGVVSFGCCWLFVLFFVFVFICLVFLADIEIFKIIYFIVVWIFYV